MDFQEDMARIFIIIYFTISQLWFEIYFSFAFNFHCLISVVCFRVTWRTFQPKPKKTKKNDPEKNSSYFRKWNSLALILKKFLYLQKLNPALYSLNHQNFYILWKKLRDPTLSKHEGVGGGVRGFYKFFKKYLVAQETIDVNISWPSNFFRNYFMAPPTSFSLLFQAYL